MNLENPQNSVLRCGWFLMTGERLNVRLSLKGGSHFLPFIMN
ncbi:hypothetical protein Xbed_03330 [Xenorhabdus beddingii]|uniref:Uncharacterized protein n=1 Tax=Xenorhabdus beddingii TaxID=40578 RepID=A0A1Y2SHE5_9GAMM|nr:hypothetical protein Xbed_03330 [Xenorhabdus beddingii]